MRNALRQASIVREVRQLQKQARALWAASRESLAALARERSGYREGDFVELLEDGEVSYWTVAKVIGELAQGPRMRWVLRLHKATASGFPLDGSIRVRESESERNRVVLKKVQPQKAA